MATTRMGLRIVLGRTRRIAKSATFRWVRGRFGVHSITPISTTGGEDEAPLPVGSQIPPFVASMGSVPLSVGGEGLFAFGGQLPSAILEENAFTKGWNLPCPSPTFIDGAVYGWGSDAEVELSLGVGIRRSANK